MIMLKVKLVIKSLNMVSLQCKR